MSYNMLADDDFTTPMTDLGDKRESREAEPPKGFKVLVFSLLMGVCFGFALEKGQVFLPKIIVEQMLMKDFTMLQMFLSAAATSVFWHSFLSHFNGTRVKVELARSNNTDPHSILWTAVGSAMLGAGMAVCGACPGTVLAQLGTGIGWSYLVLAGALLGTVFVAFCWPYLDIEGKSIPVHKSTVDKYFDIPMWYVGYPLMLALAGVVVIFAVFFPYDGYHQDGWVLNYVSWPPWATGLIVGSLQLPGILLVGNTIGSSSSYVVLVASVFGFVAPELVERNCYLRGKNKATVKNFWQPTYLLGAFLGALLSGALSGQLFWDAPADEQGMGPALSIIGGILIVAGSRCAGGCTSGAGISGFSQLVWVSFIAVAAMFGAGIAVGNILYAAGAYPSFVHGYY